MENKQNLKRPFEKKVRFDGAELSFFEAKS